MERWVGCCPKLQTEFLIADWNARYSATLVDKMELLSVNNEGHKAWEWNGFNWQYNDIHVSVIFYGANFDSTKAASIMVDNAWEDKGSVRRITNKAKRAKVT